MEGELFNPYWQSKPPECCYCPPVQGPPSALVDVEIHTAISGGFGQLSFMTRSEDAFRILEQQRQLKQRGISVQSDSGPWGTPYDQSGGMKVCL